MKRRCVRKAKAKKGNRYSCSLCGLVITVDNPCDCVQTCDIICCGEQMQSKK